MTILYSSYADGICHPFDPNYVILHFLQLRRPYLHSSSIAPTLSHAFALNLVQQLEASSFEAFLFAKSTILP